MDDLKLYAKSPKHLDTLLSCVGRISTDIPMKFGLGKSRTNGMEKGAWVYHQGYEVSGTIEGLNKREQYK